MAKRKKYLLGIDLGGTKVLAVLLNPRFGRVAEKKLKIEANGGEKLFWRTMTQAVTGVLEEAGVPSKSLQTIGIGAPGMIDFSEGKVLLAPNLSFLRNYPLGRRLRKTFGVSVTVENDVNAGLYGEYRFGAARGYRHAVGIFPGTGVGGAFLLDGRIYRGATGAAGEIGHILMNLPSFSESPRGLETLENLTGRLAIAADAGYLILKQKARNLFREVGGDLRKIKSKALSRAAKSGDTAIRDLITAKAKVLGIAMANVVNLLNPEVVVLGGGLMEALGKWVLPAAQQTMRRYALAPVVKSVKVVPAELGDYAVAVGAASLAYEALDKDRRGD
ncbi:MAG: ROK family protein [Candidatus Omnitrophota bacterium]|jgi:glucokinase